MKKFDDFWNDVAVKELANVADDVRKKSKGADSTASITAIAITETTKHILGAYHEWLLQNLPDFLSQMNEE